MKPRRLLIKLVLIALLALAGACTGGAPASSPEMSAEDSIATSVAATLSAVSPAEEQAPPTQHSTVTASPPETNFDYAGVRFYFNDALAEDITAGVEPAEIVENTWWSTPEHRLFKFNGWVINDAFLDAVIRIYPVQDFRDINPGVGERLEGLGALLAGKPADGEGAGVVDVFNAAQMYKSNAAYLRFQNGEGIRFLTQYGQALSPLGRPMMFYTFQGLTDDGAYYISAWLPATHPSLPHGNTVIMDQAFMDNWEDYVAETQTLLNGEADNTFLPPLTLLDDLIESLLVGQE